MLFNSYIFLFVFLPITWWAFRFACSRHLIDGAVGVLTIASLMFYAYWNPPFVLLILFSVLFNYSWGRLIESRLHEDRSVNIWLYTGIAVNLGLIAYFKYANFLMSSFAFLGGWSIAAQDIFLPLGISFFTFQQIAYLIDCSKGLAKEHRFLHYALFVTFFPQLIAGPIVRYDEIMPQFQRLRTFGLSYKNLALGLSLLTLGLFKKLVIADTLSPWVAAVFDSTDPVTFFDAWAGALSYTFQIYFDFSGYSDMALGLGRLFNITLPVNFNSPYKATSVINFWRRWHISLSLFLRDYLYIPLGGNRKGMLRRYLNVMITMLLGGLWHGASWTFVVWGGLHGLYLWINHGFRDVMRTFSSSPSSGTHPLSLSLSLRGRRFWKFCSWLLTFPAVVVAWVFFRATTFSRAWDILQGMFGIHGAVLPPHYMPLAAGRRLLEGLGVQLCMPAAWGVRGRGEVVVLVLCLIMVLILPNSYRWVVKYSEQKGSFSMWWAVGMGILFACSIGFLSRVSEFLYFQF
ncbi:MAG: membrane-bound O-acyltransferase family protein [Deltaproteobacteria bacterium]|nr:MAG: membrane-bound O-acyltransferase family protein [Deltaproteobacteria bacterium]